MSDDPTSATYGLVINLITSLATLIGIIVGIFKLNTIHLIINSRFDSFTAEVKKQYFAKGQKSVTDQISADTAQFNKGVESEKHSTQRIETPSHE